MRSRLLWLSLSVFFLTHAPPAPAVAEVRPFLDCVEVDIPANRVTAHLGYENTSAAVFFQAGEIDNFVAPAPPDRPGQPEVFQPGRFHRVWSVTFTPDVQIVWSLHSNEVSAERHSVACTNIATFECFPVSGKSPKVPATVGDNARQVTLGKPVHRCVPVQATVGSTPLPFENRPAHTCYEAKPTGVPNPTQVTIDNTLANDQVLTVKRSTLVCVDDPPATP